MRFRFTCKGCKRKKHKTFWISVTICRHHWIACYNPIHNGRPAALDSVQHITAKDENSISLFWHHTPISGGKCPYDSILENYISKAVTSTSYVTSNKCCVQHFWKMPTDTVLTDMNNRAQRCFLMQQQVDQLTHLFYLKNISKAK